MSCCCLDAIPLFDNKRDLVQLIQCVVKTNLTATYVTYNIT